MTRGVIFISRQGNTLKIVIPSFILGLPPFWRRGRIIDIDERKICHVQTVEYEYWLRSESDMILNRNE